MKLPNCPEHGDLVLDLARGRLSDADAEAADLVRDACPVCAEWWRTTFADRLTSGVDSGVAEAFARFSPPNRRRVWLAAAAAVVLAVGLGITAMVWNDTAVIPLVAEQAPAADAVLSTWDFEDGRLAPATAETVAAQPDEDSQPDEAVFVNDLESGDLGSWTFHS